MYSKRIVSVFGLAAIISAVQAGCNADNCLRAIRATTRLAMASVDCAAAFDVTVTPSTVTVTQYSTISETDIVTIPTTLVSTFHDTFTTVISATSTVEQSSTVTAVKPAKRAVTAVPAYASPCTSLARFSSACACIDVTPKTITALAPSTTVTLPVTSTTLTSITEPVETSTLTVEDATITETTTATTVTSVTLTTVTPASQSITGVVQFTLGQINYIGKYDSSGLSYGYATTDPTSAMPITLDLATGHLYYGTKIAKGDPSGGILQLFFVDPALSTTRSPLICSTDSLGVLTCGFGDPTQDIAFSLRSNNFIYLGKRVSLMNAGYPIITPVLL